MIEVYPHIYVGSSIDYDFVEQSPLVDREEWSILSCAKDPYHRQQVGYITNAAPVGHPEYLFAYRGDNKLFLNLVDASDVRYIPDKVINEALEFIDKRLAAKDDILIFCNEGRSRAPSIAFLWMYEHEHLPRDFEQAGAKFMAKKYQFYSPKQGMFDYLKNRIVNAGTLK